MPSYVDHTARQQLHARSAIENMVRMQRHMSLRWTRARKAAVIEALRVGAYSQDEMLRKFSISVEELASWR